MNDTAAAEPIIRSTVPARRLAIERRTGWELAASHPLVEGIHHSYIIQILRLASRRRDELERLLAVFDQGLVKGNGRSDAHVLTIEEGEYPAECTFVLRQLREAMAEEEVRRDMESEDLLFARLDPVGAAGRAPRPPYTANSPSRTRLLTEPALWDHPAGSSRLLRARLTSARYQTRL